MLNPDFFIPNAWYRIYQDNGDFTFLKALNQPDWASSPNKGTPTIYGNLLMVNHKIQFSILTEYWSLAPLTDALLISPLTVLAETLGYIAQEHNQRMKPETGLTPEGNPPMAISLDTKNSWISLQAAFFSGKDLERIGLLAKMIPGNYKMVSSDEVTPAGVALRVFVWGHLKELPKPTDTQTPITEEQLLKYGFKASEDAGNWHLPEPGDDQVSFVSIQEGVIGLHEFLLIVEGNKEHPTEKTPVSSMEALLEKLSEYGYLFEDQEDSTLVQS